MTAQEQKHIEQHVADLLAPLRRWIVGAVGTGVIAAAAAFLSMWRGTGITDTHISHMTAVQIEMKQDIGSLSHRVDEIRVEQLKRTGNVYVIDTIKERVDTLTKRVQALESSKGL